MATIKLSMQQDIRAETIPARRTRPRARLSRRLPLAQQVAEMLRERIIRGEFEPGGRIIERTLCAKLDVSRTPLREALKLLETEGLVEISQNKGARVVPFTQTEARNLFEVLAGLESLAAELAVERIAPEDLAVLEERHEAMRGHFERGERDAYFDLNSAIHEAIVHASGNPILTSTHATLMLRAKRGRYIAIVDPDRWTEAFDEHEQVMAAFRSRDPVAARRIWRQHLLHTGDAVCAVLDAAQRTV